MPSPSATVQTPFMHNLYAVILAGGVGKRFAPYSTPELPKQFLHITDADRTMIQMTYDRITQLVPRDNVLISTNARYEALIQEQLPEVPAANIVGEPQKKNTAAPIALINHLIWARDEGAVNLFLPSDHFIADTSAALEAYKVAATIAEYRSALITFGVIPTFASPDYGYVQYGNRFEETQAFEVQQFVEKPDEATAQEYIDTGEYFWNGGMFCWNADTLVEVVQQHMPKLSAALVGMKRNGNGSLNQAWLESFFAGLNKEDKTQTSIDYGVMEPAAKADRVITVPFDAGWSDVGGWPGLAALVEREGLTLPANVQRIMEQQFPK